MVTPDLMDPEATMGMQGRRDKGGPMVTKERQVKMALKGNRDLRELRGRRENMDKRYVVQSHKHT